jgi:putative DNA primase/helicase
LLPTNEAAARQLQTIYGAAADGGSHSSSPALDIASIPAALRERPQWVCWKYIERDGKQTKCPLNARGGGRADSTDPKTWSSFDDAVAAWRTGRYAGIGYVFAADDPFCGIDLDGCIDDAGNIVPSAREVISSLNSYSEISPSGRGLKVFIAGCKPDSAHCKSKVIVGFKETEVYDRDRFFTVTGQRVAGTTAEVEKRQAELTALCDRLWPKKSQPQWSDTMASAEFIGDDDALIHRAGAAQNGEKFKRLWAGDTSLHGGDNSAADLALCNLLAFWTGKDATRMDRLFRSSGLFRDKWDEKHGARTYGKMTIEKAIKDCDKTYAQLSSSSLITPVASDGAQELAIGDDLLVRLGQRDPVTRRLVLSPKRTLPTAEAYVREFNQHTDGRTLLSYGGLLMEWRDNRYCEVEQESLKKRLQDWLHRALQYRLNKRTNKVELVDFESNPATVNQALDTTRALVHLPATTIAPSWLGAGGGDRPPALEILPCPSLNLHIPTGKVFPPTPAFFTTNALDFDYDPNAEPPKMWIKFMEQLFGDDIEPMELLQEWMGYSLTGDTSLQKMLLIVGPRRSGKGTVGRILSRLVGPANVAGPTTGSLAGTFGLQPLIGKSLAIVSDARFTGAHVGTVVERLLCISGEDALTIDRKFLEPVTMKLPTKFMFLTNELPQLSDTSTALAGRFLVLRLTKSFFGKEDATLTKTLLTELPGILLWAIEGWKRLKARGRFLQPASGEDAVRDLEDLSSPVSEFVRDRCVVGSGQRVSLTELYNSWQKWCEQSGRAQATTRQVFGRDLAAAFPGIHRRRGTEGEAFYSGIGFRGGSQ